MKFRSKVTNNIRIMSSLHVKSNERRALLLTCVFFLTGLHPATHRG